MARFKLTQAFHFSQYRVRAGGTIADSPANAQAGDAVYTGLTSATLPSGCVPLDASATTMFNASRWAGTLPGNPTGRDSIDA
jgi:hypothetical protein